MRNFREGDSDRHDDIRRIMGRRRRIQPWEIEGALRQKGVCLSGSTITYYLRSMKDVYCFGFKRPDRNDPDWYYSRIEPTRYDYLSGRIGNARTKAA